MVTLRVCASRWMKVCGGIGSQRMQLKKKVMASVLKITIVLVICAIFVQCRKDEVFLCNMRDWSQG